MTLIILLLLCIVIRIAALHRRFDCREPMQRTLPR